MCGPCAAYMGQARHRVTHSPGSRVRIRERCRARHRFVRTLVINHYGGKCACCGEKEYRFLTIDHKNNDGAQHRKTIGKTLYYWLYQNGFPKEFQILCWNCNCSRHFWGKCPHKAS